MTKVKFIQSPEKSMFSRNFNATDKQTNHFNHFNTIKTKFSHQKLMSLN